MESKDTQEEIKEKAKEIKKDLNLTYERALQSRVEDIETDPEFEYREKRLQKNEEY